MLAYWTEFGSLVIALGSLLVAAFAFRRASLTDKVSLHASAADRALQRFNKFNEILFNHPHLYDVFRQPLEQFKESDKAMAFIWFVLNQMEGVYMDHHVGLLTLESFECYDRWFRWRLTSKLDSALPEFLQNEKYANYFAEPYRKYCVRILQFKGSSE